MRIKEIYDKFRQLLETILGKKKTSDISVTPKHEVEAEVKKLEIDLGLICGVIALVLTVAAIFEPVRSWWFIVPVLLSTAAMVIVTVWKCFLLSPFGRKSKLYSVLSASVVLLAFGGYGWRIRPIVSYDPARLRLMSNEDLKEAERKLAEEMREFQAKHDKKDLEEFNKLRPGSSPESYLPLVQSVNEFRTEFYSDFLGKGSAIRDEFLWRLGKTPDQAETDVLLGLAPMMQNLHGLGPNRLSRALGGMVAGPEPVSDAAEYLDGLARLLR